MKEFWNKRYADNKMAYGEEPNLYFKEQIALMPVGKVLFAAEGEGRNAVYAAQLGWDVSAFDISEEGKKKAEQLATQKNCSLNYQLGKLEELGYSAASFDCIVLIYAHFPPTIRSSYHQLLSKLLRKGGRVILEGFSQNHLQLSSQNPQAGGPKKIAMLFSVEEMKEDFKDFDFLELSEKEITLKEGLYHNGKSAVVRLVGIKK